MISCTPPLPRGGDDSVVDALLRAARQGRRELAVADVDRSLSWEQLLEAGATAWSALVERIGASVEAVRAENTAELSVAGLPCAPVAALTAGSVDVAVATVAVVLSGRPLVLLDPGVPTARLRAVVELTGAIACVADAAHANTAADLVGADRVVVLDGPSDQGTEREAGQRAGQRAGQHALQRWQAERPRPARRDAASVVVTSGSTGTPKAVVLSHAKVVDGALTGLDLLGAEPGSRLGVLAPPAFAMGQTLLFAGLLGGASLHVMDARERGAEALVAFLREQGVQSTWVTPSLLRGLCGATRSPLPDLRRVVCGGEPLQGADVTRAREQLGRHVTVANCLGSSETWHTAAEVIGPDDDVPAGAVPPGRALPGVVLEVVDDDGVPVAAGTTGVLQVRSAVLASGYLGSSAGSPPAAGTAGGFSTDPDGWAVFRTSDLARIGADGALQLRGRADDAVKVRGYLVEPVEVEQALRGQEGVTDAVVVAVRCTDEGPTQLVAYAAVAPDVRCPSPAALRRRMLERLPEWMVPAEVVLLAELPRTERGKVDRAALPVPRRPPRQPPVGRWEEAVAAAWGRVLGLEAIGRDDRFTSLGGDSLAVQELLTVLRVEQGAALVASDVAEAPTVRELAEVVAAAAAGAGTCSPGVFRPGARRDRPDLPASVVLLTPPERAPSRPLLHCFAGAGASGLSFLGLAEALGPSQPLVAYQPHGLEDGEAPDWSVSRAARRHLAAVRSLQPRGPYVVAGHSMGGLVALEVARLLTMAGEQVVSVTLLDTYAPRGPRAVLRGQLPGGIPVPAIDGGPRVDVGQRWGGRIAAVTALASTLGVRRGALDAPQLEALAVRTSQLHRRRPWSGRTLVFRSHLNPDGPCAWDGLLTGEVVTQTLPATHASVLRPPHVARVAAALAAEAETAVKGAAVVVPVALRDEDDDGGVRTRLTPDA
ncbi:Acyl-CoA synthetase (AMP-forming)/AMP-acid ligase II [Quadrisphaera granulorum]|uniref:Acyl-CoA synthetase (AMP-forming)/AMP-acid ligase II n=1 Tax=Quadrisphaera granulorum TaxID=317664 RepID=A0A316A920_9ACTN|nr:alpha/beta fold hydrolase [Quadrisphaera granulorum]PWJ54022.1 acyl-CoA synthetase (AMP-forming)/AMP-acid ligase II [Quadrisphaera granulorum]SZE96479.1 Acyl-CoA synthetase (AMP-forming)/AMP-acid ligase II [Quadrisphaera granulorum]